MESGYLIRWRERYQMECQIGVYQVLAAFLFFPSKSDKLAGIDATTFSSLQVCSLPGKTEFSSFLSSLS